MLTPNNDGVWGQVEISTGGHDLTIIHEETYDNKSSESITLGWEPKQVRNRINKWTDNNLHFNTQKCWMPQNWIMRTRKTYSELVKLKPLKRANLSIIVSNKGILEGHQFRKNLISEIGDLFPDKIDIWGTYCEGKNGHRFKGPCLPGENHKGIEPYRYYLSIENCKQDFYFSEKICVPFLFLTMPLYWGCPQIDRFFPKESYILIDPSKRTEAERIIEISNSSVREENIEYIKEAKSLVMNKYNSMATIDMATRSDNLIRDFC